MAVCTLIFMPFLCPDISAARTEDHQLAKRVLQVDSIHVSRLSCCRAADIHDMYQKVYR